MWWAGGFSTPGLSFMSFVRRGLQSHSLGETLRWQVRRVLAARWPWGCPRPLRPSRGIPARTCSRREAVQPAPLAAAPGPGLPRVSYRSAAWGHDLTNVLIDNSLECVFPSLPHNVPNSALSLTVSTCAAKMGGFVQKRGMSERPEADPSLSTGAWQRLFVRGRVLTL